MAERLEHGIVQSCEPLPSGGSVNSQLLQSGRVLLTIVSDGPLPLLGKRVRQQPLPFGLVQICGRATSESVPPLATSENLQIKLFKLHVVPQIV